jgi:EmrB/QacA subfamily drug resistance transporter
MQKRLVLSLALFLPIFILGVDMLVIGVAIAPMAKSFKVPISTVQWFLTAYAMGYAAFVGATGRMAERVGKKRFLICGVALFALTSLIIALANHAGVVIVARIVQGLSAGILSTTTIAVVMALFTSKHDQAVWIGGLVGTAGLGMALAPPLGGFMIAYFGWRSVFIINVPIAIIAIGSAMYAIPPFEPDRSQTLNLRSLFLLVVSVFSLIIIISQGYVWGFKSHLFLLTAILFFVSTSLLFLHELRSSNPLLHLTLFRTKNFMPASWAGLTFYFILLGQIFIWGVYLEKAFGLNSLQVGMRLLPVGLLMAIGGLTLRGALKKYSGKHLMIFGSITSALSSLWMALAPIQMHYWQLAIPLALFGFGFFLVNSISTHTALTFIKPEKIGSGSSLCMLTRWLGGSLGASVTSVLFVGVARHALMEHQHARVLMPAVSGHHAQAVFMAFPPSVRTHLEHSFLLGLHQGLVATQGLFTVLALLVALVCMFFIQSRQDAD